jgi:hypothetical protein
MRTTDNFGAFQSHGVLGYEKFSRGACQDVSLQQSKACYIEWW